MKLNSDGSIEGTPKECSEYQDIQLAKGSRQHFKSIMPAFNEMHAHLMFYNMTMNHLRLVNSNPYWKQ